MRIDKLKLSFLVILFMAFFATGKVANAESGTDWDPAPENLVGLDGVGIRCVVSSDRKFVHQMCKTLIDASTKLAESKGLKVANVGISWERNPDEAYRAAVKAADIKLPLLLEIFIRGTDGNQVSGSVHILASVEYAAAVEKGGEPTPRSGRLVVWESAGTGSGPAKDIAPALAGHMAKKLDRLFNAFDD